MSTLWWWPLRNKTGANVPNWGVPDEIENSCASHGALPRENIYLVHSVEQLPLEGSYTYFRYAYYWQWNEILLIRKKSLHPNNSRPLGPSIQPTILAHGKWTKQQQDSHRFRSSCYCKSIKIHCLLVKECHRCLGWKKSTFKINSIATFPYHIASCDRKGHMRKAN